MPTEKPVTAPPAPEPVAEQLPQTGGRFMRQPDGSLQPAAAEPTDTKQE